MTIRTDIIAQSPFYRLITERYPDFETNPYALSYAIEGHLRVTQVLPALDAPTNVRVMKETGVTLQLIEIVQLLPDRIVPLEASFSASGGNISYQVRLGSNDEEWKCLTINQRKTEIDRYATGVDSPGWRWDPPLEGSLKNHSETWQIS